MVYPHENGVDFNISVDEAKAMLNEVKDEYEIPLKYTAPSVTTNMIGTEAFFQIYLQNFLRIIMQEIQTEQQT